MRLINILAGVCITIQCADDTLSTKINHLYYQTLCAHEQGRYDEACAVFKYLYDAGIRNNIIVSKLMLHALRTQKWDDAYLYDLAPYWWYDEDITNKTVLLTYDGGFGDAIMFIRYAKHLSAAGAIVFASIPDCLIPLFSSCPFIAQCFSRDQMVQADKKFRISTPHLALTMHKTLVCPSDDIPYLSADEQLTYAWSKRISSDSAIRIGLCWCSSYLYNAQLKTKVPNPRSIPLTLCAPLCDISSVTFYSLVKGEGERDLLMCDFSIIAFDDLDQTHGAFMDTAALMKNLDLVITVDTSIAHLAGALGIPVWVLLPLNSDFRWFLNRADSPWYPTMRLFRQTVYGDWQPVLEMVHHALQEFVVHRTNECNSHPLS